MTAFPVHIVDVCSVDVSGSQKLSETPFSGCSVACEAEQPSVFQRFFLGDADPQD